MTQAKICPDQSHLGRKEELRVGEKECERDYFRLSLISHSTLHLDSTLTSPYLTNTPHLTRPTPDPQ